MLQGTWQDLIGTPIAERFVLRNLVYAGRREAEFLAATRENGGTPVSVALVEPEPAEIEHELSAIGRAKQLQHPNLLHVIDAGECVLEGAKMLFVVTEAAEGTLAARAARPDPAGLIEDLLAPLDWLHSQNLVYRNLDPETVVWSNGHWKLSDLSQLHTAGEYDAAEAAAPNAPPEAAEGRVLPAWDIWSLGVLIRDLPGGDGGRLAAPFDAIVRGCLEPDPLRRITSKDIRALLKPVPASEEAAHPVPPPVPRWRLPMVALAVIAIAGILLFVLLRPHAAAPVRPAPAALPPAQTKVSPPPPAERQPNVTAQIPPAAPAAPSVPAAKPAAPPDHQVGRADYFSDDLEGHVTANGEPFSNSAMTAASRQFPLGARLRVTNLKNKHSVTVRVNDRGPSRRGFVVTVTRRAAEELGFVKAGSARVKVELAKPARPVNDDR